MSNDRTERLLNEIGQLLAVDAGPAGETLLYAEVDKNFVSIAVFDDLGEHLRYRDDTPDRLTYALLELWEAEARDQRWAEIEYVVHDGRFDVSFNYGDEIDRSEEPLDRRRRIVAAYFGEKPIV